MTIHRLNIHSEYESILTRRPVDDGYIMGTIFPTKTEIQEGDIIIHPDYFFPKGENVTVLEVKEILEQRPARGDYKIQRPTFRKLVTARKDLTYKELEDQGLVRTEKYFDEKERKTVQKVYLN